jgi:chromosome segregation ATPase
MGVAQRLAHLKELQDIDSEIDRLERLNEKIPRQISEAEDEERELEEELEELEEQREELIKQRDKKELDVESYEDKIDDKESQRFSVNSLRRRPSRPPRSTWFSTRRLNRSRRSSGKKPRRFRKHNPSFRSTVRTASNSFGKTRTNWRNYAITGRTPSSPSNPRTRIFLTSTSASVSAAGRSSYPLTTTCAGDAAVG